MSVKSKIELPPYVNCAISMLERSGFEAFVVGGAVRDLLLGKIVSDFDITTSAFPSEIKEVFSGYRVIETGIKHGTVTVMIDGEPLEITTYRVDGEYEDNRHPKSVTFTRNITEDLARRDFTVNAIAFNPKTNILDPFGGVGDLENGIIRAVGNPYLRFCEDALRILRCVRFASVLGFNVEEETSNGVKALVHLLENVSAERIFSEVKKLVCGKNVGKIMAEYPVVMAKIIPPLEKSIGFEQKSKYHIYDVYEHTYRSLAVSENNLLVRLALLYHDCGKPYVFTEGDDGFRHFIGHQKKSSELAEESLLQLKCDSKTLSSVKTLVLYHDYKLTPEKKCIKRFLSKVSFEEARLIVEIKKADMATHSPEYRFSEFDAVKILDIIDEIEREGECVSLKTLAIGGDELMNLGIPKGKIIGEILKELLDLVICEELPNESLMLLEKAKELYFKRTR